ncbi:MAG: class I SAM-dependent methyltransferase [Pirellulaceae bacterium]
MDSILYPNSPDHWDVIRFAEYVADHVQPEHAVLDFGCGRGRYELFDFRDRAKFCAGVDVDPDCLQNTQVHEAKLIDETGRIPFSDGTFDLIFSSSVLEHVEKPRDVFAELARVLKPGGLLLARTPSRFHYAMLGANLAPTWFHEWYNKMRGREVCDTFPTYYRCNSKAQVNAAAEGTGLTVQEIAFWESRPEYLRFNPATYLAGFAYERIVNSSKIFEPLRAVLVMKLQKA